MNEEEFNMNYASNGAFDVLKDPISCEFVRGMGRFLSNRYALQELKNYLHNACKKAEAITNELYDLSKKEKEPEMVARQNQNQKKSVANNK